MWKLNVTDPTEDLHSGQYGGAVANPIQCIDQHVAALHDETNHKHPGL